VRDVNRRRFYFAISLAMSWNKSSDGILAQGGGSLIKNQNFWLCCERFRDFEQVFAQWLQVFNTQIKR